MSPSERASYRSVLANREFAAVLASQALSIAGDQIARIALALLVFQRTDSAALASATYAVSYLTYLVAGPVLSAFADRNSHVSVMVACDLLRVPIVLIVCVEHPPVWVAFVSLGLLGVLAPAFDSARSAAQPDILTGEAYVAGNALLSVVFQAAQVLGFALGGAVVASTSVRGALALDAATFLVSAGMIVALVAPRTTRSKAESEPLFRSVASGARFVRSEPSLMHLLTFALLGSAAVIVPEGLAVPIAAQLGEGAGGAGLLTASVPAGFLVGSFLVLRVPPERRIRLMPALALLGSVPLMATPLIHDLPLMVALWATAGAGGTVNLVASSAYMQQVPREMRGRAYGLAVACLNLVQGGFLLLGGAAARWAGAQGSVAWLASGVVALLILASLAGRREPQTQGLSLSFRETRG